MLISMRNLGDALSVALHHASYKSDQGKRRVNAFLLCTTVVFSFGMFHLPKFQAERWRLIANASRSNDYCQAEDLRG